jgi:hypothetical protein
MKKLIFLLTATAYAVNGFAQNMQTSGFFIGLNFKVGPNSEQTALMPTNWIYPESVNNAAKQPKVDNETAFGFDAQLGYFFGKKGHWGLGTGLVYFKNDGELTIESMHFEYKATDFNGDVYRQMITTTQPIKEILQTTNMSVPLVVKYRTMFSDRVGFSMDAGVVYNVKIETSYNASAAFDYEAIYKFEKSGTDYVAVYDDGSHPDASSWLITVEQYQKDKGDGNEEVYFKTLQDQGYNVGLNEKATGSGTVSHKTGSVGFLLQPSLSFRLSDVFYLNVGPYWMHQTFHNEQSSLKTQVTDRIGEYSSVLSTGVNRKMDYYGANLGLSIHF